MAESGIVCPESDTLLIFISPNRSPVSSQARLSLRKDDRVGQPRSVFRPELHPPSIRAFVTFFYIRITFSIADEFVTSRVSTVTNGRFNTRQQSICATAAAFSAFLA